MKISCLVSFHVHKPILSALAQLCNYIGSRHPLSLLPQPPNPHPFLKQSYSTLTTSFSSTLKLKQLLYYTILYKEKGRRYAARILVRLINTETINFELFWWVFDSGSISNRSNITKFKIGSLLHRLVIQREKKRQSVDTQAQEIP